MAGRRSHSQATHQPVFDNPCSPTIPRRPLQVRALLVGSGFAEEPEALNAEAADVVVVSAGLAALQALHAQRDEAQQQHRQALVEQRNVQHKTDRENREAMKAKIGDDASMRKEPGWKAHAGHAQDGKEITSAADIGAQGGGG